MSTGYNKVTLLGNISTDLELKQTATGLCVCNFTLAVNRRFAKQGEQSTDFISVVTFRHNAEFVCRYLKKGRLLLVSGSIQTRNYTNSQGQKVYVTEVVADEVVSVGSDNSTQSNEPRVSTPKGNGGGYMPSAYSGVNQQSSLEDIPLDNSLPF